MSRVLDMWAGMTGTVLDFAGATAPTGWLMCYGQTVNTADYPNLFAKIGTTYNVGGEAAGVFRIPDARGRTAIGKDDMGGAAAGRVTTAGGGIDGKTLGAVGGSESHTLTALQMPKHNHGVTDNGHDHPNQITNNTGSSPGGGGQITGNVGRTVGVAFTGISIQDAGGGQAHPNVQPGIVLNRIIKT